MAARLESEQKAAEEAALREALGVALRRVGGAALSMSSRCVAASVFRLVLHVALPLRRWAAASPDSQPAASLCPTQGEFAEGKRLTESLAAHLASCAVESAEPVEAVCVAKVSRGLQLQPLWIIPTAAVS